MNEKFTGVSDMKSVLKSGSFVPLLLSSILVLGLIFSLLVVPSAKADNLYASIRGRVLDQAGAVVPDAKITATNISTGLKYNDVSDRDGNYNFLQVPIGDYKVSAEKQGFRTFVANGIHVDLNQVYQMEVHLEVGVMSQEVMVQANQLQIETTQTQLGVTVEGSAIVMMPLITRDWTRLMAMEPGVVSESDGRNQLATNGSQSQQNSFLMDGVDTNDLPLNTPLVVPSPDAIAEFRMVSGSINPEYGRNSGAILNAVTKSGSNSIHGDAFEFYRDPFLNTKGFFQKVPQVFHQNLFGGTIGGPVFKNHTFFFFSYQGTRNRQPETSNGGGNTTVFDASVFDPTNPTAGAIFGPSATHPQGNSIALSSHLSPIQLTGSDGIVYPAGTPYSTIFGCAGGTTPGCTVGFVRSVDINSIAAKLLQFVPKANTNNGAGALRQYEFTPTITGVTDQYTGRIDHTFNTKDSIWGTFFLQKFPSSETLPFTGATLPGFGDSSQRHYKEFSVSWTHVFNSNILNEIRAGYNRFNFVAVTPTNPADPASFGFNIKPQLGGPSEGLPVVSVRGLFTLGFSANGPQPRKDQTYQGTDNFSITSGRHTMKFGFDMRRFHVDNPFAGNNDGNFTFNHNGIFSTGNAGADFLLGIPDNYVQGSGGVIDASAQEYYTYGQDQFKLLPNLTITYGVGWQIDTPLFDKSYSGHAQFAFVPGQQSTVFSNAPVGYVFNGDPGVHAAGTTHYKNFGPRLGFAYSPGWGGKLTGGPGKTSIRAGVGIFYNRYEEEQTLQFLGGAPFGFNSVGAGHPTFADPFTNIQTGVSGGQPFPYPGPTQNISFPQFFPLYNSTAGMFQNINDPSAINFNVTMERQLSSTTLLSIGYVGSFAHRLTMVVPQNLVTNNAPCLADPACGPFNEEYTHPEDFKYPQAAPCAANGFAANAPCSIYGPIVTIGTFGNSNYSALQASVKHRLSHGLDFLASYTYSHALDEASGFENSAFGGGGFGGFASIRATNPYNPRLDYGNTSYDARQRLVIGYFYQIPSIRHFGSMGWMPSRITDGWGVGGVTTFQTGFPLDVVDGNLSSDLSSMFDISDNAAIDVPSLTGKVTYFNPRNGNNAQSETACAATGAPATTVTARFWFSPGAFTCEPLGALGNAGRNILRGPGLNNWDLQLFKDTRITETTRIELRAEAYNAFNHTQFLPNAVITDISDPRFGQVTNARPPRLVQLSAKFYF